MTPSGFRHSAPSIPIISLTGVAIGAGPTFAYSVLPISRNPAISPYLTRRAFTGSPPVEASGFTGLVYSFSLPKNER